MKYTYYNGDSGRVLVNGLHLLPGVEYEVTDKDVRYAEGVTVINKDVAKVLADEGLLVAVKSQPAPSPKPPAAPAPVAAKPVEKSN